MIENYIIPPLYDLDLMHLGIGKRYFCLAHFYLQYPHYRQFFSDIRKTPGVFITLDNSAAEKSLVTEEVLLNIVEELVPDEVIAPDILFNATATIDNLRSFTEKMIDRKLINNTSIFGCPQGSTKRQWLACYTYMLLSNHVKTIGLSKITIPKCWGNITEDDVGIMESRNACVDYLITNNMLTKPVHLLGMGSPLEYTHYNSNMIRSTDSCYTVLAAANDVIFDRMDFRRVKTTNDFYEKKLTKDQRIKAYKNIDFLKRILQKS